MPHVFEVADRIHIQRLGRGAGVITPRSHTMPEAVSIMTGATTLADTPVALDVPAPRFRSRTAAARHGSGNRRHGCGPESHHGVFLPSDMA